MNSNKQTDILSNGSRRKEDVMTKKYNDLLSGKAQKEREENESPKQDFDLALVGECFSRCYRDSETLLLDEYLAAYRELCRFFKLMGRLFGFVAEDIEEKIINLEAIIADKPDKLTTIQSLLEYEVTNNLARTKIKTKVGLVHSGTRTLLRLHRALEFILEFMRRMAEGSDEAKTSQIASEVYDLTLAKYHIWIIRKMAGLAMYALPNRKELVQRMCKQSYEDANILVVLAAENGQNVYDETQCLFEKYKLLDIPYYS